MIREEIIEFLRFFISERYWRLFWLLLPFTVIAFPISWVFLYYIQYIGIYTGIDIYTARIMQLSMLCSFAYGFFLTLGTIILIDKTGLEPATKHKIKMFSLFSIVFCPLVLAIAGMIANIS